MEDTRKLLIHGFDGDDFEHCISTIKVENTWKSTQKRRHVLSDRLIVDLASSLPPPSILEIGASAGSSSLDLIDSLGNNIDRYYVTDLFFHLKCTTRGNASYFYHPLTNECILRVNDLFLIYNDVQGAFFPLGLIAGRLVAHAPQIDSIDAAKVDLLHPSLRRRAASDPRIIVTEYNVLTSWPYEPVDLIKIANVLNRVYFSDAAILKALANLKTALKTHGRLVITDNRKMEMVSLFSKDQRGMLVLEKEVNGGTDISDLVYRCQ